MAVDSIIAVLGAVQSIVTSKGCRKVLFGTYTDGTPRSLVDSLEGEYHSPTTKAKKKKKKNKKKGGKKSKKKNRKNSYYI